MKRQFPRIERRALLGLAAALTTLGAACSPNHNVTPGAPVLIEVDIVEPGPAVTSIPSDVADCPVRDGGTNGGMCDPSVTVCRQTSASNWCRCVANPAPPGPPPPNPCIDAGTPTADAGTDAGASADAGASDAVAPLGGTWNCAPFAPTAIPLFVFDRLLDTAPLGDGGGVTTVATSTIVSTTSVPSKSVPVNGDYGSNGSPNEVIFPLLGDFRRDGPSLAFSGVPEFPTDSAITITLDATKVLAKDGKTSFTGSGFFKAGTVTYTTASFGASLSTPPTTPPAADAGVCTPPPMTVTPDKTPATATFNNLVDPMVIAGHITIMAVPAATITFTTTSMDGLNVSIVPDANWPASSTITIAIDATAPDLVGDTLGAAVPAPGVFTTSAM
jgi:Bacterial Ig-like domain